MPTSVPLSVDKEGPPKVEEFDKTHASEHLDIYLDTSIDQAFPIDVLSADFLFDRQGRVAGFVQNYVDWDTPEAEATIWAMVEKGVGRTGAVRPLR